MRKSATTIKPKPAIDEAGLQAFIGADKQNKPSAMQAGQPASQLSGEPTAMLSVRIPASLQRELRVHSVTTAKPIQDIVTELLVGYLASQPTTR